MRPSEDLHPHSERILYQVRDQVFGVFPQTELRSRGVLVVLLKGLGVGTGARAVNFDR